jgi:uncharacterized membrane protein YgaE (UPF0421/DUF939 family)
VPGQLDRLPLGTRSRQYARRGRGDLRDRLLRLRQRAFLIAQVSVAATVAYFVAHDLLGHEQPFFAPVAAIISLGMSYGQRLRRVGEVTVGVAIGVLVADLFVRVAGVGLWQIALVVAGSMVVAVLLDGGPLLVTQAAVQSVFVALVVPTAAQGLDRWVDALVGGLVAVAAAAVAPQSPLRQPRQAAAAVLEELAAVLHEAAESLRSGDRARAERTLERARATDSVLEDLRQAAAEGIEVVRQSPFRRRHREQVLGVAALAEPLDRAVRNARVLVRRVAAATRYEESVPPAYADLVTDLADVADRLADCLQDQVLTAEKRPDLQRVAVRSAEVAEPSQMSATVVLAQVRSIVVDLLELTGLDQDEALAMVPRPGE